MWGEARGGELWGEARSPALGAEQPATVPAVVAAGRDPELGLGGRWPQGRFTMGVLDKGKPTRYN